MFSEEIDLIIYYRCMNIVMLFNLFRIVNIIFDCIILYSVCCFFFVFFGNCDLDRNVIFYV